MPEYFGYAERNVNDQINWSKVGKDITQGLEAEAKSREQQKAAIDKATNDRLEELTKVPIGENANANKIAIDYSDDATKMLLLQNKLMKAGKLPPRDYMLVNANLKQGTDQLFNLSKEYQKQYTVSMDRIKKGESQDAEGDLKSYYESFGNLTKTKPVIDPKTGQVNLSILEYDKKGVLQPTGQISSVQGAYNGLAQKFDRFNVMDASKAISDNLGHVVTETLREGSLNESGKIITLDYALQKPEMQKALNEYVASYLVNPYNKSSVLTNEINTYKNKFTNDANEKSSGNTVVWHVDNYGTWKPEFTKEQDDAASEYLKNKAIAQIASKEDVKRFESQAFAKAELGIKRQELGIKAKEAETKRITAINKAKEETGGEGWKTYVEKNAPNTVQIIKDFGAQGKADEELIKQFNTKYAATGLKAQQGPGGKESIVIVDKRYKVPQISEPFLLTDPTAQQKIIDYMIPKTDIGIELIKAGIIKNVKGDNSSDSTPTGTTINTSDY